MYGKCIWKIAYSMINGQRKKRTEISQHSRDSATTSEISTSPTEITVTAVTEAVGRTSDERSDASGKK
ncbi:1925_t:CDS:2 [Entrophospora sp. SA101]|nr:1925_t:CDS:2 [Entrophospora sp. SA101]